MQICYVDEAGCPGTLPSVTSAIQPVLVIGGVIIPQKNLAPLTLGFLQLKRRLFPGLLKSSLPHLHWVLPEIKGADLRAAARGPSRNKKRHTMGFLGKCLELIEKHDGRILARIWIKRPGVLFRGRSVYTSSIQALSRYFHHQLEAMNSDGALILDSRTKQQNAQVAHSIFTQKFQVSGDAYPRLLEMPTFGHSDNHVGLQLADVVVSALLFPLACSVYCFGHVQNLHVHPQHLGLRTAFGTRLRELQYRYHDGKKWQGGIVVDDEIGHRSSVNLFVDPTGQVSATGTK